MDAFRVARLHESPATCLVAESLCSLSAIIRKTERAPPMPPFTSFKVCGALAGARMCQGLPAVCSVAATASGLPLLLLFYTIKFLLYATDAFPCGLLLTLESSRFRCSTFFFFSGVELSLACPEGQYSIP